MAPAHSLLLTNGTMGSLSCGLGGNPHTPYHAGIGRGRRGGGDGIGAPRRDRSCGANLKVGAILRNKPGGLLHAAGQPTTREPPDASASCWLPNTIPKCCSNAEYNHNPAPQSIHTAQRGLCGLAINVGQNGRPVNVTQRPFIYESYEFCYEN